MVSCFDDLDFFNDLENEFLAIVYNDALMSKLDLSTEPILSPQHIDEFDLNDETSLSEYDEKEQNILYFNDLFPFNIIHPNDLKLEKYNDDNEIDIIQSLGGSMNTQGSNMLLETNMAPLPPRDQRHIWLRYQVEGYTEEIVHDFEQRLEIIFGRHVNRIHILDFKGLTLKLRQDLAERIRMVYTKDDGKEVFVSHAWRRLFGIQAPLVHEFILEFFSTCRIGDEMGLDVASTLCFQLGGARPSMTLRSERLIPDKGDLSDYWVEFSSGMDFLRGAPPYTYIRDPYLFMHFEGRKNGARLFGGYFIGRLAHHFGLVSDDGLRGLSVVARELPLIDIVDEGVQANPAPMQAPQQPPPPPATGRTMPQRLGRLEE
ncbi:hypothetical protein Tco_0902820 [Tanacetum coccineum]